MLGKAPLKHQEGMDNIKGWLLSESKSTLWDLSVWNHDESWQKWDLGDYPQHLDFEARSLLDALQGCTPLLSKKKDQRGWGPSTRLISAAAGYPLGSSRPHCLEKPLESSFPSQN